jgi:hypothetical protein
MDIMKHALLIPMALMLLFAAGCRHRAPEYVIEENAIRITENGATPYTIVIAPDAPPPTRYAAEELQRWIGAMSDAELPIVTADKAPDGPVILIGDSAMLRAAAPDIDYAALGMEDSILRTAGENLILTGGEPRGVLYSVYALLEDHLGCRWYTPEVSHIPRRDPLYINPLDEKIIPVLEYREPFVYECFDGDWCARNRCNSSAGRLEEKHGGKITYFGFVHTFNSLVPPEKYFDEHPEYFAEVNGKRLKDRTQLCCTNPDVVRIVTEQVRQWMRDHPEAFVYSVSQNDWYNFCTCKNCAALAEAEGSEMAPVLQLVNRVAAAVKDEFPGKAIDTLAYQWTRKAPKTMRPLPNVIIRLCSIECCFSHPLDGCGSEANQDFVRDMEDWSKISGRLWVWNYNTSFRHYLVPFPNLRVRAPNVRFFRDHHVTGIFEQDVYNTPHGEFDELSGWLGAKLLWNPDADADALIDEYLAGVYGPAAAYLRDYLDLIHDRVEDNNIHMNIWIGPDHEYITDRIMAKADRLWDRAAAAVADQPALLRRLEVARLSPDYCIIERARQAGTDLYEVDHASLSARVSPALDNRIQRFFHVAERCGLRLLKEHGLTLPQYRDAVMRMYRDVKKPEPVAAAGTVPGLKYRYYEFEGDPAVRMPDFNQDTLAAAGVTPLPGLNLRKRDEYFALTFEGTITIPRNGVYSFYLRSNNGSLLFIGDELIIDNGGLHAAEEGVGLAGLRAGTYPIRVDYFQAGGERVFKLMWDGPGIEKERIPAEVFSHGP